MPASPAVLSRKGMPVRRSKKRMASSRVWVGVCLLAGITLIGNQAWSQGTSTGSGGGSGQGSSGASGQGSPGQGTQGSPGNAPQIGTFQPSNASVADTSTPSASSSSSPPSIADYLAPISKMRWGPFSVLGLDAFGQWSNQPLDLNGNNRSEEHTSELQSLRHLVCRLLL